MLNVEVRNRTNFAQVVSKVRNAVREALAEQIPAERDEIVQRTKSGQSAAGGGFAPYSEGYARAKARLGGQVSPPDLTLTGAMLGSMETSVRRVSGGQIEGKIEIKGGFNRDKAEWNQGGNSAIPARRFMGLSDSQKRRLEDVVQRAIARTLNRGSSS